MGFPLGRLLLSIAFLLLSACGTAGLPTGDSSGRNQGHSASTEASPTLVVILPDEPPSLAAKPLSTGGQSFGDTRGVFNAGLAGMDEGGVPRPVLAETLPQANTEAWHVSPDGRMATTYRLRPNLVWHDAHELSAEDFVFAWRVYTNPELGLAALRPQNFMEEVVASDPRTVVVRWRQLFAEANALVAEDLLPFPAARPGVLLSAS